MCYWFLKSFLNKHITILIFSMCANLWLRDQDIVVLFSCQNYKKRKIMKWKTQNLHDYNNLRRRKFQLSISTICVAIVNWWSIYCQSNFSTIAAEVSVDWMERELWYTENWRNVCSRNLWVKFRCSYATWRVYWSLVIIFY